MKTIGCIIYAVLFTMPLCAAETGSTSELGKLYVTLDSLLDNRERIYSEKEKRIEVVRAGLDDPRLGDSERYALQDRLYNEYCAFKHDSAYKYVMSNVVTAQKLGDASKEALSKLHLAHILSVSGLFDQAELTLNELNPDQLDDKTKVEYYNQLGELNLFQSEFAVNTRYFNLYHDRAQTYRQQIIDTADPTTFEYGFSQAVFLCENGKVKEAINRLETLLKTLREGERNYSIVTSTLAYFYDHLKNGQKKEYYLLLSAISDSRAAIAENNALRELSAILLAKGDTDRAFRYLNEAIENANFYGTMLRNQQAAALVPGIVKAYDSMKTTQSNHARWLIICLSIVTLMLVVAVFMMLRYLKKRKEANQKVREMNQLLNDNLKQLEETSTKMKESNTIKDEYIGRFLDLCSSYIDSADEQRKLENRLARDKKLPELYAELKSTKYITELTTMFYQNFDNTFLKIYPTFVEEVNNLLEPQNRTEVKGEKLNTELRVLALIRLGISDNQKIASILRSSITTIYTYRSKLKAKAIRKETFEDEVRMIESFV